jgi:transcriptional regulator with XRE-family HTH domain
MKARRSPYGLPLSGEELELLGRTLRYFRERLAWTQTDLTAKAGLSEGQYSRIEGGLQTPHLGTLLRILKALQVEPWFFFLALDKYRSLDEGPWKLNSASLGGGLPPAIEGALRRVAGDLMLLVQQLSLREVDLMRESG